MPNTRHRLPHASFKVAELIELGQIDEAQQCCDDNVAFYDEKADEQRELFREAEARRRGMTTLLGS